MAVEKVKSTVSTILDVRGQRIHIQNELESKKLTQTQDHKKVADDLLSDNLEILVNMVEQARSANTNAED